MIGWIFIWLVITAILVYNSLPSFMFFLLDAVFSDSYTVCQLENAPDDTILLCFGGSFVKHGNRMINAETPKEEFISKKHKHCYCLVTGVKIDKILPGCSVCLDK